MYKKILDNSYLLIFLLVLGTIYTGQFLGITSANDFVERRSITRFPKDITDPNFMSNLNSYFMDNFGFRNILLKQYLFLKLNLLKVSKINHSIFNDQGWIFGDIFPGSDYKKIYQNSSYTLKQLNDWKHTFEKEKAHLQKQNIPYFLVIIPDRRIVYSELLPFQDNLALFRHNLFINFMKKNSTVEIIDTTSALLKAKGKYPLFFKTDSHWTNYAALAAYSEITKRLKKYYPDLYSYQEEDFDITLEKYDIWLGDGGFIYPDNPGRPEINVKLSPKKSSLSIQKKLPALLAYGDSFLNIDRRICHLCFLEEFPEMEPFFWELFVKPSSDKLLDPNPGYVLPKMKIEKMIPIIRSRIKNKSQQDRIINHLLAQAIHPDTIGLDYFFRLNFQKIIHRDLTIKLGQELIDEYKPSVVIREAIDNRIWEFERLKCNYDEDSSFTDNYDCKKPF